MENNWYNHQSEGASYSSDGGYSKGSKKGISFTQLLISLLVVALISGGLGAYLHKSATEDKALLNEENNAMIVTTPTPEISQPAEDDAQSAEDPSEKLNITAGDTSEENATTIVKNCMASVVGIYIGTTENYPGMTEEQDSGAGSGVILTNDGYIVTNNHVIAGAERITVYLQDGTQYEAKLVGTDSFTDLAVIKVEAENLPAAVIGTSSDVQVGETVYAIGNPLGVLTSSVSRGIISGLDRTIEVEGTSMTLMQTDAAVNPGNSGGGLFNINGQLIGIVNAKSASINVEGLGFAIPVDSATPIIMDLMTKGYVTGRPYIGITMQDVSLRYGNSNDFGGFNPFAFYSSYVTRVQVMSVEEGSAAAEGGMLVNDIITAVDEKEITGSSQLAAMLYEYNVGDTVIITVLRGNESINLSIVLGERS